MTILCIDRDVSDQRTGPGNGVHNRNSNGNRHRNHRRCFRCLCQATPRHAASKRHAKAKLKERNGRERTKCTRMARLKWKSWRKVVEVSHTISWRSPCQGHVFGGGRHGGEYRGRRRWRTRESSGEGCRCGRSSSRYCWVRCSRSAGVEVSQVKEDSGVRESWEDVVAGWWQEASRSPTG